MRVTEQSQYNQIVNAINRNYKEMEASQVRLSTGQRYKFPHQNVTSAINSIYYKTRITAIDRFQENIVSSKERLSVAYDSFGSITKALGRSRELALQAANGIYTREDRIKMAFEVEELLEYVYDISLAKSKGEYIFSGTSVKTVPFRAHYNQNDSLGVPVISSISYEGDANIQNREIENNAYIDIGTPGSYALWASNSEIIANRDSSNYIVDEDSKIMIDNNVININVGDNLEAIADKINGVGSNVHASVIFLRENGKAIALETREPHKIMLQDLEGSSVLQDLGLIREGLGNNPENNYDPNVAVSGKSIFEALMYLRDAMIEDDIKTVGGSALGFLDNALDNIVNTQAKVSAKVTRLDMHYDNYSRQKLASTEALSKNEDVDYAKESITFNTWQYAHKASLQTASRLLGPTLMDYLR